MLIKTKNKKIICGIYVNKYTCNGICELGAFQEVFVPLQIQTYWLFYFLTFHFLSFISFLTWHFFTGSPPSSHSFFYFSFSRCFSGSLHVLISFFSSYKFLFSSSPSFFYLFFFPSTPPWLHQQNFAILGWFCVRLLG